MNRFMPFLTLLTVLFLFNSCGTSSEELWIESDGSGRLEIGSDLSNMYPLMMMGLEKELDKGEDEETMATGSNEKQKNQLMAFFKRPNLDTLINLQDLLMATAPEKFGTSEEDFWNTLEAEMRADDTMPEGQKQAIFDMLKNLLSWDIKFQTDQEKQFFRTATVQSFDNLSNIHDWVNDMVEFAEEMAKNDEDGTGEMKELAVVKDILGGGGMTNYELIDDELHITRKGQDMGTMLGENEEAQQAMMMMKMFLGNKPYKITVHLPGKVKKISDPNATIIGKKTVEIEIPQEDLFDPEKELDIRIKFKLPKGLR